MPREIRSYAEMARFYPYLDEFYKANPPTYRELPEGTSGAYFGSRYFDQKHPEMVIIDPKKASPLGLRGVIPHEYAHWLTDKSHTWSDYLNPRVGKGINFPTDRLLGIFHKLYGYPARVALEEGFMRNIVPEVDMSERVGRVPEDYFTEQQMQMLPLWSRYLQYGPAHGSLRGGKMSGVIVDPTYRGVPVKNRDGTWSSEVTMSFERDGVHYLIPTLYRGKKLKEDTAINMFKEGQLPAVAMAGSKKEIERIARDRSAMLEEEGFDIPATRWSDVANKGE